MPVSINTIFFLIMTWLLMGISNIYAQVKNQSYTEEANVYFQKGWQAFNQRNSELGRLYADSTRQVYLDVDDNFGEGLYMFMLGTAEKLEGNFNRADSLFKAFLPYVIEKKDTAFLASLYFQIAITSEALGDLDTAIDYHYESISNYHLIGDTLDTNAGLNSIGSIYRKLKQYNLAEEHFLKALAINKRIKSADGQATNLVNLGNLYAEQKDFEKAIDNYNQAVYFDSVTNFQWGLGYDYENIGNAYAQMKQYDKAKIQLEKSLAIRQKIGGKYELAQSYLKLAQLHTETNSLKKALILLNKASTYADDANVAESKRDILKAKSSVYEKLRNFETALNYHQMYTSQKDSIINKNTTDRIALLSVEFETAEKEKEIQQLKYEDEISALRINQQKVVIGLGSIALIGLGGLLYFVFNQKSQITEKNKIISKSLLEKETLLREIHHRVKNNLQFISSLLGLQTEHVSDKAALGALQEGQDRVQSMALIHQNLYQEDNLKGVDMSEYFTKLVRGLFDSYNIRRDQITLNLDIDDLNLDVDSVIPIGLVVNELVSNSLKYAFPEKRKGEITVTLKEIEDRLIVGVHDDGIGLSSDKQQNMGESFGYRLINVFKDQMQAELSISGDDGMNVEMSIGKYKKSNIST